MIAPSAGIIEMAHDQLGSPEYIDEHKFILNTQVKEVTSAVPGQSVDYYAGYQLGVQAARALLSEMPEAVFNKVAI